MYSIKIYTPRKDAFGFYSVSIEGMFDFKSECVLQAQEREKILKQYVDSRCHCEVIPLSVDDECYKYPQDYMI